eukprot:gene27331-34032_t
MSMECIASYDLMNLKEKLLSGIFKFGVQRPSYIQQARPDELFKRESVLRILDEPKKIRGSGKIFGKSTGTTTNDSTTDSNVTQYPPVEWLTAPPLDRTSHLEFFDQRDWTVVGKYCEYASSDPRFKRQTFALRIGYDGSQYNGFQQQKGAEGVRTVQDDLLKALGRSSTAAGRTDKDVTAVSQIVHFTSYEGEKEEEVLRKCMESEGAKEGRLAIYECHRVPKRFHSLFSATWRRYVYIFPLNRVIPIESGGGSGYDVDVEFVNQCLSRLVNVPLPYNGFTFRESRDTGEGKSDNVSMVLDGLTGMGVTLDSLTTDQCEALLRAVHGTLRSELGAVIIRVENQFNPQAVSMVLNVEVIFSKLPSLSPQGVSMVMDGLARMGVTHHRLTTDQREALLRAVQRTVGEMDAWNVALTIQLLGKMGFMWSKLPLGLPALIDSSILRHEAELE